MPFADLPNVRLHYTLTGPTSEPVLILSNSLGTNFSMWDAQAPAFEKQFHLLRYDMRGHGQSSAPLPPYAVADLGRDILALADRLSLTRFHFCGLSIGGMTGMSLALQAPERLDKLILCNTAPKIGALEFWNARIQTVQSKGMKEVASAVTARWFTPGFQQSSPEKVAAAIRVLESLDPQGYVGGCAAVRDFDFRESISQIRTPTLVVSGKHDPAATTTDGRLLAEQIPGARYTELNTSHLSNIEAPAQFNDAVLSFLNA
ncbi:MAG TPA: 3-oxoadipate enol-lactonase [Candidatus Eisenbacteria bacterium]|jgi:3-oxoadipate enol-lactonase|nr:3-oxoadipate enol-lactonase [Candidatus Eisenbacteria bacterium]